MSKKREVNHLAVFFGGVADAARAELVRQLMLDYKENNLLSGSPTEHMLAKLLGVDPSWVLFFDHVFTGDMHGFQLVGIENEQSVQLAQAMVMQRHGFVQHPLMPTHTPIHPRAKAEIEMFIKHGHKQLYFMGGCSKCVAEKNKRDAEIKAEHEKATAKYRAEFWERAGIKNEKEEAAYLAKLKSNK